MAEIIRVCFFFMGLILPFFVLCSKHGLNTGHVELEFVSGRDPTLASAAKGVNPLSPQNAEILSGAVRLVTHLGPAMPASVFIPVSVGENKEQEFPHLDGARAGRAV
jgi:hypothetical protein